MPTPGRWFASLAQDLRFALRLMRRNVMFSAIAVVTLALGIGASSAVYSLLDAVVLHPLGYPEPERIQLLLPIVGSSQRAMMSTSYPDFLDWQRESRSFERMAAFRWKGFNLTGGEAERVDAIAATPGLLETLGVQPPLGRTISGGDDLGVAVISHALWVRRFAASSDILGKTIRLDGKQFIVIGVLPRSFHFQPRRGAEPDLFVPLEPDPDRGRYEVRVIARLRRGVTPARAQAEMKRLAADIAARNPEVDRRQGILVASLHGSVVQGTQKTAYVLLGAVAFLLLIACANVANLMIARGVGREREIGIRLALGAGRGRLIRQLVTESMALAVLAGLLGLGLAYLALPLLAAIAPEHTSFLSRIRDNGIQLNGAVLTFTALVSLGAAVLFGIFPAFRATKPTASSAQIGCASTTSRGNHAAGILVAIEVALSFVLLAGAGLMLGTLWRLLAVDPGFRTGKLLTISVSLPDAKYPDAHAQSRYFARVLDRLDRLSDVRATAAVSMLPITRETWNVPFEVEGFQARSGQASFHTASPRYFDTMGIPVLRGRAFTDADRTGAPAVAIVSRAMERRYCGGVAVGKTLRNRATGERFEIVGVVGDVRQLGLDDDLRAEWFLPAAQAGSGNIMNEMTFVIRSFNTPTPAFAQHAREAVRSADRDQPLTDVRTMDELIATDTASPRFVFALIGLFATVALALAAFGIYGVVSQAVVRRTGEIAVRLALGARPGEVVRLIARQHLTWVVVGVAGGILGAAVLTRLLASQLFDVKPTDIPTYAVAGLLLVAVAIVADLVPAWRATRVMPAAVLRNE